MCKTFKYRSFGCLLWMFASVLLTLAKENNFSHHNQERPLCQPGFYCPAESFGPVPCPKGTYGPTADAGSIDSCLQCPPHHYCPRPGLSAMLACGSMAQQPLAGQDSCICPEEGQSFQISDGRCHCTIGYQLTKNGNLCKQKFYDVCGDGKTRTQYGDCLDKHQWSLHCRQQVCLSAEDYQGYDRELSLCVCKEVPGTVLCGDLCRSRPAAELHLQCRTSGDLELVWSHDSKVLAVSGRVLEMLFKQWDSQGTLLCNSHPTSTRPVYIVLTTDTGFLGLSSGLPEELRRLFPVIKPQDLHDSAEEGSDFQKEVTEVENISHGSRKTNSSRTREDKKDVKEELKSVTGVHNPTACLILGDVILFTVDTHHYPQYDLDSLYNTNKDFDWGAFRQLKEELTLSWTPPSFFSVLFSQPGVYVFTLSSHQHKHLYVRVMPAGVQCYEPGPFFPSIPRHVTRVGISRRRNLLLRPDWFVTGGLLLGAVVVLCLCVTILILFREYGWPEKEPIKAQYRLLQLAYHMDDYSSKGSRVISLRKPHRGQQARMAQDTVQAACADSVEEFWDYEHQVDLEAFSSNTFYRLLLKQNLSVTTLLGQLTTEVKELYQGVLGKLQLIQPCLMTEERVGEGYERMRREVEKEVARRKSLGSQLRTLLNSQLQVLTQEQQAQQRVYTAFTAHLRECTRLSSKIYSNNQLLSELQQNLMQRLTSLVDEMGELVSGECQRQGAWELLGEGPGAKLLCPDSGAVLTKDHIFGPDGSIRATRALHFDSITGLIRPNARTHMLLSSCHTMEVPPDFFLHPQTCRVMPIVGNVTFDAASSTLVFMNCPGDNRKLDRPLLPFIPYPTTCLSDQPLPSTRLQGLRPGQTLQLGAPMTDAETGVPVPILAVTIHPQTGLVCPLGGVHVCPITRLPQPIQIGYPMLEPRTGNMVLTVGVSLDPATGAVLPVGGVLLAESFIEPLSGQMLRIGGASIRMGQVLPNSGGYQALLSMKSLAEMFKVLDILKPITEEWGSDQVMQHPQPHPGSDRASGQQELLLVVTKELQQAWGRSLYCQLQLQTRLESLLDWAMCLQQDGGILGEIPLPGSDMCVPALLGMEYPDPMGSGVSVPVLGCKTDLSSGIAIPLIGTMEDPDGKGLVAIRCGSQTVDPVTGVLAPVVGARLDVSRKNVLPVTASYWLTAMNHTDSVQVEALQREVCARNNYWQHQRQREEDFLSDLDSSVTQYLGITQFKYSQQVQWSGRQLREAALELWDSSQTEAQRRAAQHYPLALIVPPHVLHILTLGDEEEWDHQTLFHSELLLGLDKVDVCMEQLQQDQEKWTAQGGDWTTTVNALARELRHRDVWEQCSTRQTELETALGALHFVRHHSQLRANTAQAVLCGNLWYREFGLVQCQQPRQQVIGLLQQRMLPILERLNQLLEDKQPTSYNQQSSGLSTKQAYGLEIDSRVWTSSMPVVKGNSTHSLRGHLSLAQSQDTVLQTNSAPTHNSRQTASLGIRSRGEEKPRIAQTEEDWNKLLKLSPVFHLLRAVELQLRGWACGAGLLQGELRDGSKNFADVLDAQWECEGELIPLDLSVLNPREFLVYQHGLFLIRTLHNLNLTPPISLQIAASLPNNNYLNNAFRNSFFYQELGEMLFVRRQRLHSVGGFSLLLLHCLSHVKVKNMTTDSSPAFQRLFYKVIQACLGELFQTRLDMPPSGQEANGYSGDLHRTLSDSLDFSLFDRLHKPSRGLLSEEEVEELQGKHRETSLFYHLESLLREKNSTEKGGDYLG